MTNDFENSFRQMLKSVVREVFDEVLRERQFETHRTATSIKPAQDEERFLLRAREAAKRLAISQRHLHKLTVEGVLPCVRVGSLVHYSVEAIERWIRASESIGASKPREKAATGTQEAKKAKSPPAAKPRKTEPKKKQTSKKATRKTAEIEPKRANKKRQPKKEKLEPEEEKRIGPFDLLLEVIGVNRDALPSLTNGDLMRIAEVDIPTLHGWQWHNRPLPDEALQRLKDHFIQYRKD